MKMYDEFSAHYDHFVDWSARLAAEMPFIERQLEAAGAWRVLDAACGTGMHAIELARRGYEAVGADLCAGMIERARANAAAAGIAARFVIAGFGELSEKVGGEFDALLCLGNSLPHVLTPDELRTTLTDFVACLRPGGLLLIQNRNFDAVLVRRERWMEPQAHREGEAEWLFLRFYDFEPDDTLTFNLVTLRRQGAGHWEQRVTTTRLWPLRQEELTTALAEAGFVDIVCYGDMAGAPFDPGNSGNLIVIARSAGGYLHRPEEIASA